MKHHNRWLVNISTCITYPCGDEYVEGHKFRLEGVVYIVFDYSYNPYYDMEFVYAKKLN